MIRISSMRLKPELVRSTALQYPSINDKNLKYEIETATADCLIASGGKSINDKNLKYEIETLLTVQSSNPICFRSMIRISSMRLKRDITNSFNEVTVGDQ